MTPQEQQLIDGLIDRIRNTQVTDKDLDAERYLQQGFAGNPDALYILAQTVLVQQYGLNQAQQQIEQLQAALDEARQHVQQSGGGSFLSKIFGGPGTQQTQYQPNNPGYPPPYAPAYAPAYTQPAYPQPGGGSFLRGALQTAAGVAIGEMAFDSVESLFHGFGGGPYGYGHQRIRRQQLLRRSQPARASRRRLRLLQPRTRRQPPELCRQRRQLRQRHRWIRRGYERLRRQRRL